jgi:hypothetical protein
MGCRPVTSAIAEFGTMKQNSGPVEDPMTQPEATDRPGGSSFNRSEGLAIMKMIHDHYRMDIEQIWKRGAIYLTVSSALLGLVSSDYFKHGTLKINFSYVGIALSLVWLANAGVSCYWIKQWKDELKRIDKKINPYKSFTFRETISNRVCSVLLRPHNHAIVLPIVFVIIWIRNLQQLA